MAFRGIPAEALTFYEELEADNSRPFWQANKARHEEYVKGPVIELTEELAEFGPFHVFRPYHDVRFAKNRPPYKTHQGAYAESEGGAGYYLQVSATGLRVGGGYYAMAKDQLDRFRRAVDADATGAELVSLVDAATRDGYDVGAIGELKTAPRGYPKDHPRIELLRRKGLVGSKDFGSPRWLHTKSAAARIRETWAGLSDLFEWLDAHVGPSTLPPDRPF